MVNVQDIITRDLRHVWHPCAQMKDFETAPLLHIESARGSYLYTDRGPLIDAISSWWCKSLGHAHPAVIAAIEKQLQRFEHVIAANTTHENLVELAERLTQISRKQHVFFASDGASAVEIAMKMAIHAQQIKGHSKKNQFIALKNGYHGETLGTMSVSDLGLYKAPYAAFGLPCHFIEGIPYASGPADPLWTNCDAHWESMQGELDALANRACAVIVEPLVQGAGGMLCYSPAFLKKLADWAKANQVYLIADEIMTGIGRTGEWLACDHAKVEPDLICLSKGLTSGALPLSCVLIDHSIFELFYADYDKGQSFLHSHTYSANPLAIAAALATVTTMQQENILNKASLLGQLMRDHFQAIADQTGLLTNIRGLGAIVAGDLRNPEQKRLSQIIAQRALDAGALLRPIGNTLYWLPPLNTDAETIGKLAEITLHSIRGC